MDNGVEIFGSGTTGNIVQSNNIGLDASGTSDLGQNYGVYVYDGAQDNVIGPQNVVAYNNVGVAVDNISTLGIAITQNSIYSNTDGIKLYNHANGDIAYPVITNVTPGSVVVTGTACPLCTVELFSNSIDSHFWGQYYEGSGIADAGGNFTITLSSVLWPYLTATATDAISGTSEFSAAYEVNHYNLYLPLLSR
jgi:hypothetical protein